MKKCNGFLVLVCAISLLAAGCEKKERVDYGGTYDDVTTENNASLSDSSHEDSVNDLKATLGIEKDIIENEIKADNETIFIEAEINLPDTDKMYTMTVREKYLTDDDKKRIVEYFVEPDTVKVDKETQLTKEKYDRIYIEEMDNMSDEQRQYMEKYRDSLPESLDNIELDYSLQNFLGFAGEDEYRFVFDSEKEVKVSSFQVYRPIDCDKLEIPENLEENTMTEEEAVNYAKKVLEELDIKGLDVAAIRTNTVVVQKEIDGREKDISWRDGYQILFTRSINGICVNGNDYWGLQDWDFNSIVYPKEMVNVIVEKKGIRSIWASGLMEEVSTGQSVKLLDIGKIEEVINREVVKNIRTSRKNRWTTLLLTYDRVDGDKEGEYCYLPVWRLTMDKNPSEFDNIISDYIHMNAIDGSVIETPYADFYWKFY